MFMSKIMIKLIIIDVKKYSSIDKLINVLIHIIALMILSIQLAFF